MPEKEKIYSTKLKHAGFFNYRDLYRFMYEWLSDNMVLNICEDKYSEKVNGNKREVEFEWTAFRKLTDYFKFEIKIKMKVEDLENVQIKKGEKNIMTNKGRIELQVGGNLIRDWQGKFERTAFQKFMRAIYERWVIPATVEEYEDKLIGQANEFIAQVKAFLDLQGN